VGEKGFLESSDLKFASFHDVGEGVLVVAWEKAFDLKAPEDLLKPEFHRVAIPDEKHAIYGKAASAPAR
jgi:molybdate transport system substrate-binding protein